MLISLILTIDSERYRAGKGAFVGGDFIEGGIVGMRFLEGVAKKVSLIVSRKLALGRAGTGKGACQV